MNGGVRQAVGVLVTLHLTGGGSQGAVQTVEKSSVAVLHRAIAGQLRADQQVHVPGGHHLLENADKGEIGQMLPVVFLALGPGDQAVFRVVIHHGSGQGVAFVQTDGLPLHVREDLIHIKGEIRQSVPVCGTERFQLPAESRDFFHVGCSFALESKSV